MWLNDSYAGWYLDLNKDSCIKAIRIIFKFFKNPAWNDFLLEEKLEKINKKELTQMISRASIINKPFEEFFKSCFIEMISPSWNRKNSFLIFIRIHNIMPFIFLEKNEVKVFNEMIKELKQLSKKEDFKESFDFEKEIDNKIFEENGISKNYIKQWHTVFEKLGNDYLVLWEFFYEKKNEEKLFNFFNNFQKIFKPVFAFDEFPNNKITKTNEKKSLKKFMDGKDIVFNFDYNPSFLLNLKDEKLEGKTFSKLTIRFLAPNDLFKTSKSRKEEFNKYLKILEKTAIHKNKTFKEVVKNYDFLNSENLLK